MIVEVRADGTRAPGHLEGRAFVFHSGTPSAAVPYKPLIDAVLERGLQFVTYSRPGYAGSTEHHGRQRRRPHAVAQRVANLEHDHGRRNRGLRHTRHWTENVQPP